jgi:cation diffusion facilitator CzcD-associated flavoprotein CzcO
VSVSDETLDWLIVGGGLQGVHAAVRLVAEAGVAPERLRIVDPGERLLARWRQCTARTGMSHLRSPSVHHLDIDPWALRRFAGHRRRRKLGAFAPPYERPSLALFDAHCDHVVQTYGLAALHVRASVEACTVDDEGVSARLGGGGRLFARRAVLALGASEQPSWPDWAPRGHPRVRHIFEASPDPWPYREGEAIVVVGGGISAAQVALRLVAEGLKVHVVSRHALREHQFDSEPGWLGPRHMAAFAREPRHDERRAMITAARHRGSLPPDVRRAFSRAITHQRLTWHQAHVVRALSEAQGLRLSLSSSTCVEVDRVLLATGFAPSRPGGAMLDDLISQAGLRCAACGFPIVDSALRWHPRLHVTGPLAELELGPVARNISGARRAGERLVVAAGDHRRHRHVDAAGLRPRREPEVHHARV